ncbi:MAG: PqqD family protein [Lachnospiraceae bacterium]|nr:PqqD family protein [Lachnospiraceae bacterium]MCD7842677.1 PqqD family protein [Lachnospiraceae bacterium]
MTDSKKRDMNKSPDISSGNAPTGNRYQLRRAAGVCWLLDMEQPGIPYVKPVSMNEMGADIWELYAQGFTAEKIAEQLGRTYDVPVGQVKEDVYAFLEGLKAQGVVL